MWLLIKSLYWFNPFIHVGYRLYTEDMEHACDIMTISCFDNDIKSEYIKALIDVVCDYKKDEEFPVAVSFREDKSIFDKRFKKLNE